MYTIPSVNVTGGNLTLSAASFPAGASFNFTGTLYVDTGGLTVTGNLPITVATLRATGLTISGATTTVTDNLGTVYVTGTTTVSGRVALTTNSTATSYFGGEFGHTPSTAVTDNLGPLYFVGNAAFSSASGNVTIAGGKNVHAGGTFTITGPDEFVEHGPMRLRLPLFRGQHLHLRQRGDRHDGRVHGRWLLDPAGTLPASPTSSDPSTSPARRTGTAARRALVCGVETTSAATSVPATLWTDPTSPAPMFAQIFTIDGDTNGNYESNSGPYDLVLGNVWVDGNAGTGDVAVNFSAPSSGTAATIMCPLLATTEKTCTNGYINIGTLLVPDGLLHAVRQRRSLQQHV